MIECEQAPVQPAERLMQAWICQNSWSLEEAILLALGISPEDAGTTRVLDDHSALLTRAKRSGERFGAPEFWLWWAERNNNHSIRIGGLPSRRKAGSHLMASILRIADGKCSP